MTQMAEWALQYADQGFAVFPLHSISSGRCTCKAKNSCTSPGKHPHWEAKTLEAGVKDATTEPEQIQRWWKKWPNANIGIATGRISGIVVIDIDGAVGGRNIKLLQRRCGKLPPTLTSQTGNGAHIVFRSGGHEYRNRTGIYPGIDVRGDGGYIVAPPSVHIAGKRYRWSNDGAVVDPPIYVRQLLAGKFLPDLNLSKFKDLPDLPKPHLSPDQVPMIQKGCRNDELFRLAGRWRWEDKTVEEVGQLLEEVNRKKCQPPVGDKELKSILKSSMRYR